MKLLIFNFFLNLFFYFLRNLTKFNYLTILSVRGHSGVKTHGLLGDRGDETETVDSSIFCNRRLPQFWPP